MKKYRIGYTQGVYDMFHIGHLNLLLQAKELCDFLIVGINSDQLVNNYKNKSPIICDKDRARIVENIRCVDKVIIVDTLEKKEIYKKTKFDAIFIGSDWKGNDRWKKTELEFKNIGVDVVYLKHTDGISTSLIRRNLSDK